MLITPEYQTIQEQFHIQRPDYGVSGSKHCEPLQNFCKKLNTKDVLDYGCGKATLQRGLPFPIQNYDPCIPEYSRPPSPAAIVVCTDVLEHIEPDCIKEVMDDIRRLTLQLLFVNVATRPAQKVLPDGRNAHILQQTPNWWLSWLLPRFNLHSFQSDEGSFTALLTPLPITVPNGIQDQ